MSSFVPAATMIALVRTLTNTETLDQANNFVTDAEILAYLNSGLAELYDVIVENHDDDFYRGTTTLAVTAGTSLYPLIADFYKVTSVDIVWGPTIVRPARRFTEAERDRFKYLNPVWSYLTDVYYRTLGANLEVQPVPQAGVTLQINYVPAFQPLIQMTDCFDSVNNWHWFAIWDAAMCVAQKDENAATAQIAMGKKEQLRARIVTHASTRNDGEPPRIQAIQRYSEGGFDE